MITSKEGGVPVSNINDNTGSQVILASRNKSRANEFSKILKNTVPEKKEAPHWTDNAETSGNRSPDHVSYIELGRISRETPTVSHILKNNPEFSGKCWDIIFSSPNRGKDFTKMMDGTLVALKPGSNEIVWGKKLAALDGTTNSIHSEYATDRTAKQGTDQSMLIGTISRENPTVSHLFEANPNFNNRFWDIIHSPVNSHKEYTSLMPGTQVVLDTKTMELSFHKKGDSGPALYAAKTSRTEQGAADATIDHESLADAVKPYIGTPYEEIDCYGLIVRGLQNQGIQYRGHGGLREKLEALAVRNGLPRNAYFSGEGLVEKAGKKVFSKSLDHVSGPRQRTDEIYSEMMPFLREGFILSFSTPTQGHTGIVARQGEEWTYINSGVIDNQVSPLNVSKGVGEEFLKAELNNWLVLAAKNKEPLTVTLGHVEKKQS
ncbi:MAG: hypothetical protein AMK71_12400 [Nitrospira bacterium SG8_35_4]|nr:MAG: hypothetical protein AMK71_12400 [Nitrospira bacterium SG8_35_4]